MRFFSAQCYRLSEALWKNSACSQWTPSYIASAMGIAREMSKLAPFQERRMIDRFTVYAKGGDGGNGCCSFHRSIRNRRGVRDGGNGGRGGDVILECSHTVWDFSGLQHHINAARGGHGAPKNKIGTRGADKVVSVPVGTVIHLVEGEFPSRMEKHSSDSCSNDIDTSKIPETHVDSSFEFYEEATWTDLCKKGTFQTDRKYSSVKRLRDCDSGSPRALSTGSAQQTIPQHWSSKVQYYDVGCGEEDEEAEPDSVQAELDEELDEWKEEPRQNFKVTDDGIRYNVTELTEQGQRIIIAEGGRGGLGNVCNSRVSYQSGLDKSQMNDDSEENDIPSLRLGTPGSKVHLIFELKSIADVGLVGLPNAGKSTLLGALSKAKPQVGNYAFTTLRPNLGKLRYEDFSVTIADIPGLIKGAHANRGLGHAFLRHIERSRVLAYVVDLAAALDGNKGTPPWEQLRDLVLELEMHQEGLSGRPCLIVANKIDEQGAEEVYAELKRRVEGVPIFPICAVLEEGVSELKDGLRKLVDGVDSSRLKLDNINIA